MIAAVFASTVAYSQIGINTTTPKATLDVMRNIIDSNADGIIAPRLTGDEIQAKDALYNEDQIGAIIYATAPVTTSSSGTKTANITQTDYYYFDGVSWIRMGETEPFKVQGTNRTATLNTENVYQAGKLAVGFTEADDVSSSQFEVKGTAKIKDYSATGWHSVLSVGTGLVGQVDSNAMYVIDSPDDLANGIAPSGSFFSQDKNNINAVALKQNNDQTLSESSYLSSVGENAFFWDLRGGIVRPNEFYIKEASIAGNTNWVKIEHSEENAGSTSVRVNKGYGVEFQFAPAGGSLRGFRFPKDAGLPNQILTTLGGTNGTVAGIANLEWKNIDNVIGGVQKSAIRAFSGLVMSTDYTVLGTGNVILPLANADNKGRLYNFVHNGTNYEVTTVSGTNIKNAGASVSSYSLDNSAGKFKFTVQSDGTNWVIIDKG